MEHLLEIWSLVAILAAAFLIGWAAEAAQTFIPRALALSILAWMQTLPEFAVEGTLAWHRQRDLLIANLTGSLRLLVGLGLPSVFFVHWLSEGIRKKKFLKEVRLPDADYVGVLFLQISILYFAVILWKGTLTCVDGGVLIFIYATYLFAIVRLPAGDHEETEDLPWVARRLVQMSGMRRHLAIAGLFLIGGLILHYSIHPFINTLQSWSVHFGLSTFVFVQWVAPFLSEFPEYLSAVNWARQRGKVSLALMNIVSSNINQWTVLAAMIPIVYNLSLHRFEPLVLDQLQFHELAITIAQSAIAVLLLLDLRFALWEAALLFSLWFVQFLFSSLRTEVLILYGIWFVWEIAHRSYRFAAYRELPRVVSLVGQLCRRRSSNDKSGRR